MHHHNFHSGNLNNYGIPSSKMGKHACVSELLKMMIYKGNCYKHGSTFAPETDVVGSGKLEGIFFHFNGSHLHGKVMKAQRMHAIEVSKVTAYMQ